MDDCRPVLVRVNREYIRTTESMKYLGVILDSRLNYNEHFSYIGEKMAKVSRALSRLIPNVKGPSEAKRRLYATVLGSVALYGAPVWYQALLASAKGKRILRAAQKTVVIRVCSAYRTISFEAAVLLARTVPYELAAAERGRIYERIADGKRRGLQVDTEDIAQQERETTMRQWCTRIEDNSLPGKWTRNAIRPNMASWLLRKWGSIDFYTTQLLSDHGGFAVYLNRIERMEGTACFCCDRRVNDDARHTLFECPAWEVQRVAMTDETGPVTELADVVRAITESQEAWLAFSRFAASVLRVKRPLEDVERARAQEARSASSPDSLVSSVGNVSLAVRNRAGAPDGEPFELSTSSSSGGRVNE